MQDLDKFKNEMNLSGKNVYVGNRYVPKHMGGWDNTQMYEPLSIVQYQGNSFTSRQYVPSGVEITNEEYWASTGNYNAQIEQYRQDVVSLRNNTNNLNNEVVNARNGEATLNERLNKDSQEVNTQLANKANKSDVPINVEWFGAKADWNADSTGGDLTGFDNAQAFQDAFDYAPIGAVIEIPEGSYRTTKPLPTGKHIEWRGVFSRNSHQGQQGTTIFFDNCNGVNVTDMYSRFSSMLWRGKKVGNDVENKVFGNVGINSVFMDNVRNTGGLKIDDIYLRDFDIGVAIYAQEGATWAGAYQEFYTLSLDYCDVGVYIQDKATHAKFYGGHISQCDKQSLVVGDGFNNLSNIKTNVNFFGTTIEASGDRSNLNKPTGILVDNANVNIYGGYIEQISVGVKNGGKLSLNGTFVHADVPMYAETNGHILTNDSLGTYQHVSRIDKTNSAETKTNWVGLTGKSDTWGYGTRVKSGVITTQPPEAVFEGIHMYSNLKAKDVTWIKLYIDFKINSGVNAPNFKILPSIGVIGVDGGSSVSFPNIQLPTRLTNSEYENGGEYTIEYYYPLPTGSWSTGGLQREEFVEKIRPTILFSERSTIETYEVEPLDIKINEFYLEVNTSKYTNPYIKPAA